LAYTEAAARRSASSTSRADQRRPRVGSGARSAGGDGPARPADDRRAAEAAREGGGAAARVRRARSPRRSVESTSSTASSARTAALPETSTDALPRRFVAELRAEGFTVVDPLPALEQAERDGHGGYFREGHWNAKGHQIGADALFEPVRDALAK
jgi:hypothetical protein